MTSIRNILADSIDEAISAIRSNIPNASGESAASLQRVIIEEAEYSFTAQLLARPFFANIETGRGPYTGAEVGQQGAFADRLAEWCRIRGFPSSGLTPEQYSRAARWLSWYINRFGDKQFRSGSRRDIYSSAIEQLTDNVERRLAGLFWTTVQTRMNRI